MHPFTLVRPRSIDEAVRSPARTGANDAPAEWIAGGTDIVQLLAENVRRPSRLVDLDGLLDNSISAGADRLRIGAAARISDVASHPGVRRGWPSLSEALLSSASGQIRNMATVAGNLFQRTRCPYFRDVGFARCNKRQPGSGCEALDGENRLHAVFGTSEACIATHASDLAVALAALDAIAEVQGWRGKRRVPLVALYREPDAEPHLETTLAPGDLVTAIEVPTGEAARRSSYVKVRDRASFAFALVSAAAGVELHGRRIRVARLALGGVATRPWRVPAIENALVGRDLDDRASLADALSDIGAGARPRTGNAFKVDLARRTALRALELAGAEG